MNDIMLYSLPTSKNHKLVDNIFNDIYKGFFDNDSFYNGQTSVRKEGDNVVIEIEMPGTKASEVSVTHLDGMIRIEYKRRGKDKFYEFKVHRDADLANAKAKVENGLFTLTFGRLEPKGANKIEVTEK